MSVDRAVRVEHLEDERLADYRFLRDRDLRRQEEGLFVGEQLLVVEQMLRRPGLTRSVLVADPFLERVAPLVPADVPLLVGDRTLLERVAGFAMHRGVLAIGRRERVEHPTVAAMLRAIARPATDPLTLLLLEDIANIDNMGQLFRNAAAFGVDGVILSPRCHDPLYRKVVRVSIGHVLNVPFARSDDWARDLADLRATTGVTLVGAALDTRAIRLSDLDPPSRVGVVVGAEFAGLSDPTAAACDHLVRIPMAPGVDSLNVAVASALCLDRLSRADRR